MTEALRATVGAIGEKQFNIDDRGCHPFSKSGNSNGNAFGGMTDLYHYDDW
jgi:hypothetical protein